MSNASLLVPNDMELHCKTMSAPALPAVAVPSNVNAAAAMVPIGGLYRGTADPALVYVRTTDSN